MDYSVEGNETMEQLELLIGKENALKVFHFYEGSSIYFPKRIGLDERKEQIYAYLQNGHSYNETARKYGYSKSYIRKIEKIVRAKRCAMMQSGLEVPKIETEEIAEPAEIPIKVSALTTPQNISRSRKGWDEGDLFYGL